MNNRLINYTIKALNNTTNSANSTMEFLYSTNVEHLCHDELTDRRDSLSIANRHPDILGDRP